MGAVAFARRSTRASSLLAVFLLLAACGGGTTVVDEGTVSTTFVTGHGQIRFPGTPLLEPIVVRGNDAKGLRVHQSGQGVVWTVTLGGGSLVDVETRTDADGRAQAVWRLGPSLGEQTLEVSVADTPPVTITARAVEAGPIVFNYADVSVMNADGSDVVWLGGGDSRTTGEVAWSPDGGRIVFADLDDVFVIDLATLAKEIVAPNVFHTSFDFAWSPDGSTILYSNTYPDDLCGDVQTHLFTMAPDGSGLTTMVGSACHEYESAPAWSPDGTTIAYEFERAGSGTSDPEIWLMNADGSNRRKIGDEGRWPEWLPDGQHLVFGTRGDFDGTSALRLLDSLTGMITDIWVPDPPVEFIRPGGVSPDGRYVAVTVRISRAAPDDVFIIDIDTGEATNVTADLDRGFIGPANPDWRW